MKTIEPIEISLDKFDQEYLDALCERTGKDGQDVIKLALAFLHQQVCINDNKAPVFLGPYFSAPIFPQPSMPVIIQPQQPSPIRVEPWWEYPVTICAEPAVPAGNTTWAAATITFSPGPMSWVNTTNTESKGD